MQRGIPDMSQRRCPNCGEYVPSNALTCPKCFAEVPRDESGTEMEDYSGGRRRRDTGRKSMFLLRILSILPAFFGVLGLGQIYLEPRRSRGYWFLLIGLFLFAMFTVLLRSMLDSGILSAVLLLIPVVIVLLIYLSAAVAVYLDAVFGSVFNVMRP